VALILAQKRDLGVEIAGEGTEERFAHNAGFDGVPRGRALV